MSDSIQVCTFALDPFLFGVEVARIDEVIRHQKLTRVPLAPPEIRGLINLRGQIVTAIDLRTRLDLPPQASERSCVNVVIRDGSSPVSLLVDRICDVIHVDPSQIEPLPGTVRGIGRDLIQHAYKLPDQLILLLDVNRVVDVDCVV